MRRAPADVPVVVGADDARDAAAAELSDPAYRAAEPSLVSRVLRWFGERVQELLDHLSGVVPGGPFGLLVLLAVLVLIVVVIRLRTGKLARSSRQARQVFTEHRRTAEEYRSAAEAAAASGDFGQAVRERFRAVVRALEDRALLEPSSGRTADEAAVEAGRLLPHTADALRAGAALFDEVHYGGRPATAEGYRRLVELDESCRTARPSTSPVG